MRTVSTFSFGALLFDIVLELDVLEVLLEAVDDECEALSSVPVISTLCPTCALNFESSASRRYVLPAAEALDGVVAPAVPAVLDVVPAVDVDDVGEPVDIIALVRMKLASVEVAPAVPLVPVAPAVALDDPF